MGKVEEVARAIDPKAWQNAEAYCDIKGFVGDERTELLARSDPIQRSLTAARAAISVIRKPTPAMSAALSDQLERWVREEGDDEDVFYAPIDVALSDEMSQ